VTQVGQPNIAVQGIIILKWTLRNFFKRAWTGLISVMIVKMVGCSESSNGTVGITKCREFPDGVKDH
jgi:hypothetical protein